MRHAQIQRVASNQKGFDLKNLAGFDIFLLFFAMLVIICLAIIAWFAPPNNADSMIYHMSRVVHWIQNQQIAFYPTHTTRQLYQNPWAEYAIMHFQLLSGDDRFANFIQWSSMVGSAIGVSAIAKQFGAGQRGQIFSAVVCITIPMGILQASSTQNNYVVSFWLITMVYFFNKLREEHRILYAAAMGAGLGLAILTKATAYLFVFPFMLWVGVWELVIIKPIRLKYALAIMLIATLLNANHLYRNYNLTGNPLGSTNEGKNGEYSYVNGIISPRSILSNVVRNFALHLGTPFDNVNSKIISAIEYMHTNLIGIDVNDRRITWLHTKFYVFRLSGQENVDGNPLHFFLIGFSLLYLFVSAKNYPTLVKYSLALLAGFLLFCAILKWQPWHSRLHLPLFVLFSPLVGTLIEKAKRQLFGRIYIVLLVAASIPYLLFQDARPLLGQRNIFSNERDLQYIYFNEDLSKAYKSASEFVASEGCPDIGLIMAEGDIEYPLWVLAMKNCKNQKIRIEHIGVTNESGKLESEFDLDHFMPGIIIKIDREQNTDIYYHAKVYKLFWIAEPLFIYKP